jgi:hypothetical protein
MTTYKVVEDQQGNTAYAGPSQDKQKPKGVTKELAEQHAKGLNAEAEKLGIKTRYRIEEF